MTITKKEFAKMLADRHYCTIKEANEFVNEFTELIFENVEKGITVNFQGFGKFEKKEKKSRRGVNPNTKEMMDIDGFYTILFKAGSTVKNRLNNVQDQEQEEDV